METKLAGRDVDVDDLETLCKSTDEIVTVGSVLHLLNMSLNQQLEVAQFLAGNLGSEINPSLHHTLHPSPSIVVDNNALLANALLNQQLLHGVQQTNSISRKRAHSEAATSAASSAAAASAVAAHLISGGGGAHLALGSLSGGFVGGGSAAQSAIIPSTAAEEQQMAHKRRRAVLNQLQRERNRKLSDHIEACKRVGAFVPCSLLSLSALFCCC